MLAQRASGFTFLDPSSIGWGRVWEYIRSKYGDVACACPETNEVWQYMGSFEMGSFEIQVQAVSEVRYERLWIHEFRHRSLNGERKTEQIPGSKTDFEICRPTLWVHITEGTTL